VPEITYEGDDDGQLGNLPMVHVPMTEQMPLFLMLWEARENGSFEPGLDGEEVPVVEWDLRQYARMDILKEKLPSQIFDAVRMALGLQPLAIATAKGKEISQRVRENVAQAEQTSQGNKPM